MAGNLCNELWDHSHNDLSPDVLYRFVWEVLSKQKLNKGVLLWDLSIRLDFCLRKCLFIGSVFFTEHLPSWMKYNLFLPGGIHKLAAQRRQMRHTNKHLQWKAALEGWRNDAGGYSGSVEAWERSDPTGVNSDSFVLYLQISKTIPFRADELHLFSA